MNNNDYIDVDYQKSEKKSKSNKFCKVGVICLLIFTLMWFLSSLFINITKLNSFDTEEKIKTELIDSKFVNKSRVIDNYLNDYSMSLDGNVVNGTIDIYHGSNRFQFDNSSYLEINWSVKIEFYYDVQDKEFDGANIYGFLENPDMEEIAYYQYELSDNLLNGRQYSTLETQLYWTEDFFEINDYFAYIEDINSEEVANVTWADYYNTTAIIDFDASAFGDFNYIRYYNIWSFSKLYQHVDTLNALYSINASDSYDSGYTNGYDDGYDVGYASGVNNGFADNAFKKLFNVIMNAPFNIFSGLLNFEIFGVNLFALFSFVFTTMIIFAIVKLFLK